MKSLKLHILTLIALILVSSTYGKEPTRFASQIEEILQRNQQHDASQLQVIFTGSSSIRRWKDVSQRFPQYNTRNHGFGGSQFSDLLHYYDELIKQHAPDIIFIYEGDNDIAAGKTPALVMEQAIELVDKIKRDLPQAHVILISPKPCLANWDKRESYKDLNTQLKKLCQERDNLDFADVWEAMVDEQGIVFQDIFIADGDHMNAKGYDIWYEVISNCFEKMNRES